MVKLKLYTPNQLMNSFWGMENGMFPTIAGDNSLDVYEKDSKVYVEAAVAGVKPEDVHVTFEEGVLRIDASTIETEEEKSKKGYYKNEMIKEYHYSTTLPRMVEANNLEARVEHGIVTITAPVAEAAKARRIEVKSK